MFIHKLVRNLLLFHQVRDCVREMWWIQSMLVNYGPIGLIQKVLQQDDLAIFIYMVDAFIVSLMLQWLKIRVLNVKYFNRNTTYMYYLVLLVYLTLGYKTIKQGSFQILELTWVGQKSYLKNGCKKRKKWTSLIIFKENRANIW